MEQGPAAVDDVGHVAFSSGAFWRQEGFAQAADDLCRIVQVEQRCPDAILAHGADAVGDHQPAGFGFDGRPAVPDLHGLPHLRGAQEHLRVAPIVGIVREHDEEVLVILPRKHRVAAINPPGEDRHAFVLHGGAVEGEHAEVEEVLRFDELGQDGVSVVGRVGSVIHHRPIVFSETDKARVFDAITLVRRDGEDDALAHGELRREIHLIVGVGEPLDGAERGLEILRDGPCLAPDAEHASIQIAPREVLPKRFHHGGGVPVIEAHLVQLDEERRFLVAGIGVDLRHGDEAGDGVQTDAAIGSDEAGAELDGRNVPFAGGAQAHDESQAAIGHAILDRMGNDGWIEECGGFQRVLSGKECADEELARAGEGTLREEVGNHPLVIRKQGRLDIEVPGVEFLEHGFQGACGVFLAEGEGATDDGGDAVDAGRDEGADDDTGALRNERDLVTAKRDGSHKALFAGGAITCSA